MGKFKKHFCRTMTVEIYPEFLKDGELVKIADVINKICGKEIKATAYSLGNLEDDDCPFKIIFIPKGQSSEYLLVNVLPERLKEINPKAIKVYVSLTKEELGL